MFLEKYKINRDKMKILITGAAGYLGSQLTSYMLLKGHQIRAFDNMYYGGESLLFGINNKNLEIVRGDVRNEEQLNKAMESVDCVIHLAGIVGEPACNLDKSFAWEINHDAAIKLVDLVGQNNIKKMVFISTCSNYGVSKPNELVDENSQLNPLSDYAKAKVAVEKYIMNSSKVSYSILRLGTLCGLSARMRFDLMINEIGAAIALDKEIDIYTPQSWRPYVTVNDAAVAIEKIVGANENLVNKNIFNIVSCNLQKLQIVEMVLKNFPQAKIKITDKAPDLRDYKVNGDKFTNIFGKFDEKAIENTFLKVVNSVKNQYFYDSQSAIHTATSYKKIN